MEARKRLSDILMNSARDRLEECWNATRTADDLKPLPTGEYRCRIIKGELFTAKTGTPGYKLSLEVLEGEHSSRRLWHDLWLSEAALTMTKRDLLKLGIERLEQMERPLPDGIIVTARVALQRGDDGTEFNRVSRFIVVAVEPTAPEPFPPLDPGSSDLGATDAEGFDSSNGEQAKGEPTP